MRGGESGGETERERRGARGVVGIVGEGARAAGGSAPCVLRDERFAECSRASVRCAMVGGIADVLFVDDAISAIRMQIVIRENAGALQANARDWNELSERSCGLLDWPVR